MESLRVTSSCDQGDGSLRWALEIAAQQEFSEIDIDSSVSHIHLEQSLPVIASNLKLNGHGVTISGVHACRIFRIDAGQVELSNLSLVDGLARGAKGCGSRNFLVPR